MGAQGKDKGRVRRPRGGGLKWLEGGGGLAILGFLGLPLDPMDSMAVHKLP